MSSAAEAKAAAHAASQTGIPVWVAWTLHEDRSGRLRSEETISEAYGALGELPVDGVLANCCAPESITKAVPKLVETGRHLNIDVLHMLIEHHPCGCRT